MVAFNCEKYLKLQSEKILERINNSGDRLYLEFGGKLFDDHNAARVLPGFEYNAKIKLLQTLKDISEIIICINATDIEKNKIRADYGITYGMDVLRIIDKFSNIGLKVSGVVVTQYQNQAASDVFVNKLKAFGIKTYTHSYIEGYPNDMDLLLSDSGYGANEYVETEKPLVVITAPGPGSGKLATCMSQLYHEHKKGTKSQYAKFETFPVWNLPLKHPVNVAYEAATVDLDDVNMIDPFHLEKYEKVAVNYNRDIEVFPVVRNILQKITGNNTYNSPTDMGVNMVGFCLEDEEKACFAAKQEVIRRYYHTLCDYKKGIANQKMVDKIKLLMNDLDISLADRNVVEPALKKSEEKKALAVSIRLNSGEIITGRTTDIMTAGASCVLNAVKCLAGLDDKILLISENILKPIQSLKVILQEEEKVLLDVKDVLLALSVCAVTNPTASMALEKLKELNSTEAHSTYMFTDSEEETYRNLKICLTSEPNFMYNKLYIQ